MGRRSFRLILSFLVISLGSTFGAPQVPRPSPEFAVNLTTGGQVLLSAHRGKTVAMIFLSTTCPHCYDAAVLLSKLQSEYGPRGFQVLGAAFNDFALMLLPGFTGRHAFTFPIGYSTRQSVLDYLQNPGTGPVYVPQIVFIDRKGVIRAQHAGESQFFESKAFEGNLRKAIEGLISERGSPLSKK